MKKIILLSALLTCASIYSEAQSNYVSVVVNSGHSPVLAQLSIIYESGDVDHVELQTIGRRGDAFVTSIIENTKIVHQTLTQLENKNYKLVDVNTVPYGVGASTTTYLFTKSE